MGTIMQVAGVWKRKRWQYGVSLPKFFSPPRLIGPQNRPRQVEPIVQQYFAKRPEEDPNFPRPHWARDKPLGHYYKEKPYFLKKLRDAAAAQISAEDNEVGKAASVEEAEVVAVEEAEVVAAADADVESSETASEAEEFEEEEEVKAGDIDVSRPPPIGIPEDGFLPLSNLQDNPYSRKNVKRLGRGIGSGKGKTCGRGHKGQKSRRGHKPRFGFEGGQTPLRLRLPRKHQSKSPFELQFKEVGLDKIKQFILQGKIDPTKLITMKTLHDTRCSGKYIQDGVLLLGRGQKKFDIPIHIEVSRCTTAAKIAIEAAGGTVRKVHYNKLGLKALIDPLWFKKKGRLLPRAARPKPKIAPLVDSIGRLPAPLSPILPEGFVLRAPVYGYPWSAGTQADKTNEPEPPKTDA